MSEAGVKLGKRIREIRMELGLSQEEVGLRSSINPAHLGQIERATKMPTVATIEKIANALGIPVAALFISDVPPIDVDTSNSIIKKINAQLSHMTESERKDILKIIRLFRGFRVK